MIIVSFVSIVAGVAFFCWLLFTLAVYSLPFFAGLSAGLAAFHSGSGVIGSIIVGMLAGGATLAIGQIVFATVRMPLLRAAIGLLYAVPASIAGYHATLGLAHIGVPSEGWRETFAVVGAILVGGHGLGAHVSVCPAACRAAHCGRSGIVSTGGRDQGQVSLRFIIDQLAIGAMGIRPRDRKRGGFWSAWVGQRLSARPTDRWSLGSAAVCTDGRIMTSSFLRARVSFCLP